MNYSVVYMIVQIPSFEGQNVICSMHDYTHIYQEQAYFPRIMHWLGWTAVGALEIWSCFQMSPTGAMCIHTHSKLHFAFNSESLHNPIL